LIELHAIPHDERGPHPQDIELAAISQRVDMAGNAIETFSLVDAGF
jgi:hypothetical protein